MKVTITDIDILSEIKIDRIHKYLLHHGWSQQAEEETHCFTIWTKLHSNAKTSEVVVPKSEKFRDYPERVGELLSDIEHAEDRSQLYILREINYRHRIMSLLLWLPAVLLTITILQRFLFGNGMTNLWYDLNIFVLTQYVIVSYYLSLRDFEWLDYLLHRKKHKKKF